jgi:hypothetical protein
MKNMKCRSILLVLFCAVNLFCAEKSFGQCSDLSIDTMYFDTASQEIRGDILNEGSWYVIYPFIKISIDSNMNLSASNQIDQSYLDTAEGWNNGITAFFFTSKLLVPFSSIPENTVFTGTITITDPNDTSSFCVLPFQWQMKTGSLMASVNKLESNFKIYPNPLTGSHLNISLGGHQIGRVAVYSLEGALLVEEEGLTLKNEYKINMSTLETGMYIIRIFTEKGWMERKIIKV